MVILEPSYYAKAGSVFYILPQAFSAIKVSHILK